MAQGNQATINGPETLLRVIERRKRLAIAIENCGDADRLASLKAEHAKQTAILDEVRAALPTDLA